MIPTRPLGGEENAVYPLDVFKPLDDQRRCSPVIVVIILLLALGVRLGWSLSRPTNPATLTNLPDQVEYLSLATSLLAGEGLSMVDARFGDKVYAFRMPGYPLFCAMLQADLRWIRVGQAVLDVSTVLATLWLARRWLPPALSYVAALFVVFDPIGVFFSSLILSETLFTALLTWGIACLAHGRSPMARGAGAATWWVGVGLLIASIYVRPAAMSWATFIAAAAVIHEHGSSRFKPSRRVPVLTLVALLTAIALLPWAIRNRAVLERFIFTTTNDGFTMYDSWNTDSDGRSDQSRLAQLPLLRGLSEVQRSDHLKMLAFDALRRAPSAVVMKAPTNLGRLWSPWPLSAEFGSKRLYVIGAASHAVPLFVLALLGLVRKSIPRGGKVLLLAAVVIVTVAHAFSIGSLRYRMPIHPMLAVLAASALAMPRRIVQTDEAGNHA